MAWGLVDDRLHGHPKAQAAGDAMALWVMALSWCRAYRTNGAVTRAAAEQLAPRRWKKHSARLVEVGMWKSDGEGWKFHDWEETYKSADEVSSVRSEAGKKGAAARWLDGKSDSKGDGKPHGNLPFPNDGKTAWQKWQPGPSPIPDPSSEREISHAPARDLSMGVGAALQSAWVEHGGQPQHSHFSALADAVTEQAKLRKIPPIELVRLIVKAFRQRVDSFEAKYRPAFAPAVLLDPKHWAATLEILDGKRDPHPQNAEPAKKKPVGMGEVGTFKPGVHDAKDEV